MARHPALRSSTGLVLVALALGFAVPAHAQGILGRARDRARQAVAGNQPGRTETCASNDYDRAVQADVSEDVVTRYLRALQARDAEIRRIARENTPEGQYFARVLLHDSLARRHNMFRRHYGPDWERYQRLHNVPPSTDMNVNMRNMQAANQVERDIDENRVRLDENGWDGQEAANKRIDGVAKDGGTFSVCEWGAVVDIIPQVVSAVCQDRSDSRSERGASEFIIGRPSGLRTGELRVIRAHAFELARGLSVDCPSDEELAALRRERAQQDSSRNAMAAWQACQQRIGGGPMTPQSMGVNQDSMRVWQRQLDDAQKRGDQATIMAIGMKMGMAMAPGMQQRAAAQQQANQQCGPMPGTPK